MSAQQTGWWTRYFIMASGLAMVLLPIGHFRGMSTSVHAMIGLWLIVLPMIFGMGYLLLPSFGGTTLATPRVPGIHFVLTYLGGGILVGGTILGAGDVMLVGATVWGGGVFLFVGSLLYTLLPVAREDPWVLLRGTATPIRSTKFATAVLPIGVGYLLIGAIVLILAIYPHGASAFRLQTVVHLYGAGVAFLLILALGIRLMTGFFHVVAPRTVSIVSLGLVATGPAILATHLWRSPWFEVGATMLVLGMVGYTTIVGDVLYHTERRRVGLWGIVLGAVCGLSGVLIAATIPFGIDPIPSGTSLIAVHAVLMIDGFLVGTIIGYVYLFYPVTTGRFRGSSEVVAVTSIFLVVSGAALHAVGLLVGVNSVMTVGIGGFLLGAACYAYLVIRRFQTAT